MDTRYKIFEEVHPGGSHVVLKAHDTQQKRDVSIRQIFTSDEADMITEEQMTSFKNEALRLLSLHHPCINMFHAIMHDDQGICLITDMQETTTLHTLMTNGPLRLSDFLQIAFPILDALEFIHQNGVLHRALHPDNIQVNRTAEGRLQIMLLEVAYEHIADLGQESELLRRANPDAVIYMAPEQLLLRGELGASTDLYALGCIFYYCLSGTQAFQGIKAMDTAKRHRGHNVVHLHDLCPDLPAMLCDWVMWLINPAPQDRPVSARQAMNCLSTMCLPGLNSSNGCSMSVTKSVPVS